MYSNQEDYNDAFRKAVDFIDAYEKLPQDVQRRLILDVIEKKGGTNMLKAFLYNQGIRYYP